MSTPAPTARIHLIPALRAPRAIVLRRKPSKTYHIMAWNTETDHIEYGSWFHGRIYETCCDVSPNGRLMVYAALGDKGNTWNGVCIPPALRTVAEWDNLGTWNGGGWWTEDGALVPSSIDATGSEPEPAMRFPDGVRPASLTIGTPHEAPEFRGIPLYHRLTRDGWHRAGPFPKWETDGASGGLRLQDDPGWFFCSRISGMTLRMFSRGRGGHYWSEFRLDERPALLDDDVTWATWDCLGQLLVGRLGRTERYTVDGLRSGKPTAVIDFEHLVPPWNRSLESSQPRP